MVHFLSHDNVFLAQLLLNVISKGPQKRRTRPAAVSRPAAPAGQWADFAPIRYWQQEDVGDSATPWTSPNPSAWWVGPEYDLRRCRCYMDWERRAAADPSASVCHCGKWCPSYVTPPFLTYNTSECGTNTADPAPYQACYFDCFRRVGWEPGPCGQPLGGTPDLNERPPCPYPTAKR